MHYCHCDVFLVFYLSSSPVFFICYFSASFLSLSLFPLSLRPTIQHQLLHTSDRSLASALGLQGKAAQDFKVLAATGCLSDPRLPDAQVGWALACVLLKVGVVAYYSSARNHS